MGTGDLNPCTTMVVSATFQSRENGVLGEAYNAFMVSDPAQGLHSWLFFSVLPTNLHTAVIFLDGN
jgi:hypothetical protein